jgi:hypothetical protein
MFPSKKIMLRVNSLVAPGCRELLYHENPSSVWTGSAGFGTSDINYYRSTSRRGFMSQVGESKYKKFSPPNYFRIPNTWHDEAKYYNKINRYVWSPHSAVVDHLNRFMCYTSPTVDESLPID